MPLSEIAYDDAVALLVRRREASIAVCVPTVDEAATIEPLCQALVGLRMAGAVDRVLVLDESSDETAELALRAGADVVRQSSVLPEFGPVRGKGDAMWRALAVVQEDVVVFVDGDTVDFLPRLAADLAAAVAIDGFTFAKATYRRPLSVGGVVHPTGGGRVTELTAKPLLGALLPPLRGFTQPLAGELAATTDLLRSIPFATGYSVDVALLIDAWREVGLDAMAEVDAGVRQNRHRPLDQLGPMAEEVLAAILERAGVPVAQGRPLVERPPMASVLGAARGRLTEAA